jgi:hypothetical protein
MGDNAPYWDMLSLNDVRDHEKEMVMKRDAQWRANRQLRNHLEGQMRENSIKKHINKMENHDSSHEIIVDRMKRLEKEHENKVVFIFGYDYSEINI